MASRSLGSLVLDVVAKVGGFTQGMTLAERASDKSTRAIEKQNRERAKAVSNAWSSVSNAIAGAFAGVGVVAALRKIGQETIQSQNEQAQLAAALKSTGEAAGYNAEQLNKMATAIAGQSIFGQGDIVQAQTRLLSYTGIVGEQFPRALQAAIDMATRLGIEVPAAAEAVGKALDSPKDGLEALSKQGFRFTDDQKALVKRLQETGRAAEAQGIVLDAVESAYAGAAAAARDTFGGALKALGEQMNDLFTGDDADFAQATRSINTLTGSLASPETAKAFSTIIGWVADLGTRVVTLTANFVTFLSAKDKLATLFGQDDFGKLTNGAEMYSEQLEQSTKRIELLNEAYAKDPSDRRLKALNDERQRWQNLQRSQQNATDALKNYGKTANSVSEFSTLDVITGSKKSTLDPTGAAAAEKARKKAAEDAAAALKKQQAEAERYLETLRNQLVKTQDLNAYEKLMLDVKDKIVVLSAKQLDQAQGLAVAADMAKDQEETRLATLNKINAEITAQRDLMAQIDGYNDELNALGMGDKARADIADRTKLLDEFTKRLRAIEDQRNNALALTVDSDQRAKIEAQYKDQIEIERNYQTLSLDAYNQYTAAKRAADEDWTLGASRAVENYLEGTRNLAGYTESALTSTFSQLEDALGNFVTTGKLDFKSLVSSILADLIRLQIKIAATDFLKSFGGKEGGIGGLIKGATGAFNSAGGFSGIFDKIGGFFGIGAGRATGGAIYPNTLHPVNEVGPELLSYGNKQYLMGGSKGGFVTPITPSGNAGGQGVVVNNYGNGQVETRMTDGQLLIEIDKRIDKRGPKMVEAQLSNPNSRGGKALSRNTTASWKRSK